MDYGIRTGYQGDRLAKTIELFDGEADIVEEASEQAFFERTSGVKRNGGTAMIRDTLEGAVTSTLVDFFEAKPPQDGDEFAGGQGREFFTAHA